MFKKFLGGLFGGDDTQSAGVPAAESVEYNGYQIVSEPVEQSGQFRVSGWICKQDAGGELLEHRFERSDLVPSREACDELMLDKARRFIDQIGDEMFTPR